MTEVAYMADKMLETLDKGENVVIIRFDRDIAKVLEEVVVLLKANNYSGCGRILGTDNHYEFERRTKE